MYLFIYRLFSAKRKFTGSIWYALSTSPFILHTTWRLMISFILPVENIVYRWIRPSSPSCLHNVGLCTSSHIFLSLVETAIIFLRVSMRMFSWKYDVHSWSKGWKNAESVFRDKMGNTVDLFWTWRELWKLSSKQKINFGTRIRTVTKVVPQPQPAYLSF